ncbi:MAG: class I SAM-dependent methyltransferase [Ruminococcus sp.]|nr:class I SAM-dependent methyltransferase [Ruminococcus sp.]MCM1479949.1 class I SAM-dependent methyltransferase [Muribaculaceae bacterium]
MRIANNWTDYRLIDCTGGEKLELWGDISLIRPDPQIIWKTEKKSPLWNSAHGHYHRSEKGGGQWSFKKKIPESWVVGYGELRFNIRPTGFKHTGLFPEQAVNWDYMDGIIRTAVNGGRQINVLNLFAYTGGATLACANAGASVCHVDASKGMVQWARDNAAASGLSDKPIRWIVDDCEKFVTREIKRGRRYDAVIMDPPSYGRGPTGEVWKLEDSIYDLVKLCTGVLNGKPLFFLLNSYTTGLSPSVMAYILKETVGEKFGGTVAADEIGLPVETGGGVLPCGSTAVWEG